MEPVTTALVAGATFILKGFAGEIVKEAYKELKSLLVGQLSSLANLEEDPADEDYVRAASKELQKKGLAENSEVLAKAHALAEAIEREPADRLAAGNIDISGLKAAQDVIVKRLHSTGNTTVKDIDAKQGKIEIEDVSTGGVEKN